MNGFLFWMCRKALKRISGIFKNKTEGLEVAEMKKVILIGDSIRRVYDAYVQNRLRSSSQVYYPEDNCRFAHYVLKHFGEWLDASGFKGQVDVVHWNAGLHDVAYLYGDDIFTPIEWYGESVERVYKMIKHLAPEAKQIFATSTRIIEERYQNPQRVMRYNKDIEAYNRVAVERLSRFEDVLINDLYALTKEVPDNCYSDETHLYTDAGRRLLGDRVTEVISEYLQVDAEPLEGYDPKTGRFYVGF